MRFSALRPIEGSAMGHMDIVNIPLSLMTFGEILMLFW